MRVKKKQMFQSILLTSTIIACLLLAGCKKDEPVDQAIDDPVDHSIPGYAYESKGQYDQAIEKLGAALDLDRDLVMTVGGNRDESRRGTLGIDQRTID